MNTSRHAAPRAASQAVTRTRGFVAALGILSAALAAVLAARGILAVVLARRIVTPDRERPVDTRILALDTAAQTITLSRTPDTELPGRYGLFTTGTADYLKLGSVLAEDGRSVKRKLLTHIRDDARIGRDAAFSGWYYDDPGQLQLPYSSEMIGTPLGPCPAWLFPAARPDDPAPRTGEPAPTATWVIQVHGRGTDRRECLRAVPVFRDAGVTSLLVSYRNDGIGPRSRAGTYALGATEWRDVEAAIGFARRRGAERIILMGWSMGGAVVLQTALASAHRDAIVAIVLESPVVDWREVLDFQARLARVPSRVAELAVTALGTRWAGGLVGTESAISFDSLDMVARAAELRHPILILHSDDDGFVPSGASHALAAARPDLVTLVVFDTARHTKLWNYDQDRWTTAISTWLGDVTRDASGAPAV